MAGSVNLVILVGNCGKDPELRTLQDGTRMVNLTVATSESWIDKASGEKKEKTEWHRIVVFNDRTAGVAEKYVRKGMKLYIEGQLQTRKWTDQTGAERYSTEIVIGRFTGKMEMLSRIDDTASPREDRASPAAAQIASQARQGGLSWDRPKVADLDDEIPF